MRKGDLKMEKEIREMAKKGNIAITGAVNYPHIDWIYSHLSSEQKI